jgi:hypothetical protein
MSNFVSQINTAIETTVKNVLGSSYQKLDYVFDISLNNFRANVLAYGVRPLSSNTSLSITQNYTFNHEFEVILTDNYKNKGNDLNQMTKTLDLYSKMDDIFKSLYLTKAGLPNIVLNIDNISTSEIEFFNEENVAILRSQINVKYRNKIA